MDFLCDKWTGCNHTSAGLQASLCLLKTWQAAQLAPILLPHDRLPLATNLPKSSFEGSPLLPFPGVTCVQVLAQGSVLEILLAKLGARGLLQSCNAAPAGGMLGFGFSSPAFEILPGETEWEAGGSPYTWHCVVFLPGRAAGFWYLSWDVTGVEVLGWFTVFHTKCMRCKLLLAWAASISTRTPWCSARPQCASRQCGLNPCSCSIGLAVDHYSQ